MVPDIVIMSMKSWNKLPADVQQMIQEAADESVQEQKRLWKEKTDESLKTVQERGVTVYNPEKAPFREKVKSMHDSYKGTEVGELIAEIEAVQ
jgi:TRAP-type C4-dicarboxylate transport system substrate-binding protein